MKTKWKPLRVVFVGDQPSSKNVSPEVPFVGTPSYKRLLKWIAELDLDIHITNIINSDSNSFFWPDKVVYLGSKAYNQHDVDFKVPKVIIDHPSPRNRNLNDPKYEKKMLKELKEWLYD